MMFVKWWNLSSANLVSNDIVLLFKTWNYLDMSETRWLISGRMFIFIYYSCYHLRYRVFSVCDILIKLKERCFKGDMQRFITRLIKSTFSCLLQCKSVCVTNFDKLCCKMLKSTSLLVFLVWLFFGYFRHVWRHTLVLIALLCVNEIS